jgi:hypothetical protein
MHYLALLKNAPILPNLVRASVTWGDFQTVSKLRVFRRTLFQFSAQFGRFNRVIVLPQHELAHSVMICVKTMSSTVFERTTLCFRLVELALTLIRPSLHYSWLRLLLDPASNRLFRLVEFITCTCKHASLSSVAAHSSTSPLADTNGVSLSLPVRYVHFRSLQSKQKYFHFVLPTHSMFPPLFRPLSLSLSLFDFRSKHSFDVAFAHSN